MYLKSYMWLELAHIHRVKKRKRRKRLSGLYCILPIPRRWHGSKNHFVDLYVPCLHASMKAPLRPANNSLLEKYDIIICDRNISLLCLRAKKYLVVHLSESYCISYLTSMQT